MSLWLLLLNQFTIGADDKPTSIAAAARAVEANMKTREGKAYDAQVGRDLAKKYPPVMKGKEKADGDAGSFDILSVLIRMEPSGRFCCTPRQRSRSVCATLCSKTRYRRRQHRLIGWTSISK